MHSAKMIQKNRQDYCRQIISKMLKLIDAGETPKFMRMVENLLYYCRKRLFWPDLKSSEVRMKIIKYLEDHEFEIGHDVFLEYKSFFISLQLQSQIPTYKYNGPNNPDLTMMLSRINKLRRKVSVKESCICEREFVNYCTFHQHLRNVHSELYINASEPQTGNSAWVDADYIAVSDANVGSCVEVGPDGCGYLSDGDSLLLRPNFVGNEPSTA